VQKPAVAFALARQIQKKDWIGAHLLSQPTGIDVAYNI
jgi:hypothetical protein